MGSPTGAAAGGAKESHCLGHLSAFALKPHSIQTEGESSMVLCFIGSKNGNYC